MYLYKTCRHLLISLWQSYHQRRTNVVFVFAARAAATDAAAAAAAVDDDVFQSVPSVESVHMLVHSYSAVFQNNDFAALQLE